MKLKGIQFMILSLILLSLTACGNNSVESSNEITENSSVEIKTEINENNSVESTTEVNTKIDKEKALEIVVTTYEKYFDIKIDSKDFADTIKYMDSNECWLASYTDEGSKRAYYASLEKDGELVEIGYENTNKSSLKLDEEEAKNIAMDFIKKNNFSDNEEDIKFVRIGNLGDFDFTYGKDEKAGGNKAIYIHIDAENKSVCSFTLSIEK